MSYSYPSQTFLLLAIMAADPFHKNPSSWRPMWRSCSCCAAGLRHPHPLKIREREKAKPKKILKIFSKGVKKWKYSDCDTTAVPPCRSLGITHWRITSWSVSAVTMKSSRSLTAKELPGHSNAMSAVKSTSYNKNTPCWCIHNLPVPAPKPVNGTHVGNETTW